MIRRIIPLVVAAAALRLLIVRQDQVGDISAPLLDQLLLIEELVGWRIYVTRCSSGAGHPESRRPG